MLHFDAMKQIALLDYGGGNLGSVAKAVTELGFTPNIITSVEEVRQSEVLILPGQGAISQAMTQLRSTGLDKALLTYLKSKKPFLGICLGMQLLFEFSEEDGGEKGLGYLKGQVTKFTDPTLRIPHMGWNKVMIVKDDNGYFKETSGSQFAYFAHSYFVETSETDWISTTTTYGKSFVSSIQNGDQLGIQFHPEKSGAFGMSILKHFLEKTGV